MYTHRTDIQHTVSQAHTYIHVIKPTHTLTYLGKRPVDAENLPFMCSNSEQRYPSTSNIPHSIIYTHIQSHTHVCTCTCMYYIYIVHVAAVNSGVKPQCAVVGARQELMFAVWGPVHGHYPSLVGGEGYLDHRTL